MRVTAGLPARKNILSPKSDYIFLQIMLILKQTIIQFLNQKEIVVFSHNFFEKKVFLSYEKPCFVNQFGRKKGQMATQLKSEKYFNIFSLNPSDIKSC
jgi:hypothetical protein